MAILSSDKTYVTVEKGDCLWSIAELVFGKGKGYRWVEIADLASNKSSRDYLTRPISRSQTIIYPKDRIYVNVGGSSTTKPSTAMTAAVVEFLGPLAGENRTLFLKWSWNRDSQTEKYLIEWIYTVQGGLTLYATSTVSVAEGFDANVSKQTTWSVPDNATNVQVKVKPIAKTEKKNDKETTPWKVGWSSITSKAKFDPDAFPPDAPPEPKLTLDGLTLTARIDGLVLNTGVKKQSIHLQIIQDDVENKPYESKLIEVKNSTVLLYTCTVKAGHRYKARCRMRNLLPNGDSEWTNYTDNVYTQPKAPTKLTAKALSENDVYLEWKAVDDADDYEYEYTTKKEYFDTSTSQVQNGSVSAEKHCANLVDLETGNFTYFFRVRAKGEGGESEWSNIAQLTLGKKPAAPTTWSSTTTAIIGKPVKLHWVHNSEDGSSQTFAQIELNINGNVTTITQKNENTGDDIDNTSEYILDTSGYSEDTTILWRVCTAGVLTDKFGDWSVQRSIDVYVEPTLELSVTKELDGGAFIELDSFPFYVQATAGPPSQFPTGYHLTIVANEGYETVDHLGNPKIVSAGDAVYSEFFDNNIQISGAANTKLYVKFTPDVVDLENNISYTLTCTASMDSGLTAEETMDFTVMWTDIEYIPNAEIGYDAESYTTIIRPYCTDADGNLIENVALSVYRREYDGAYTEIMKNIPNNGYTFTTDPHPALDYARYRIVATDTTTGAIGYFDIPGYVIGESAAIIQWNEEWTNFDTVSEEALADRNWTGSLVRLPYNIDISVSNNLDVSLVEYIGRKHPVSYYGTHRGEISTLSTEIPATDTETLYAIRRLSNWPGDVYIRLPNGIGYWANVSVRYNENHREMTVPITIDITRVEGGM